MKMAKYKKYLQPKRYLGKLASFYRGVVVYYDHPHRAGTYDLIVKMKMEYGLGVTDDEAYNLAMAIHATRDMDGEIAEVGVFGGGTARLIRAVKRPSKHLYLFDTFEDGLPEPTPSDAKHLHKGMFDASFDCVRRLFEGDASVELYKGVFPDTAGSIVDVRFSFVHLDVDLYESTRDALEFFYPRMVSGGVIISHDYVQLPGVRKAVDEFFRNRPEPVLQIGATQCLIVKI